MPTKNTPSCANDHHIYIILESSTQVKDVRKIFTIQINFVSETGIKVKRCLVIIVGDVLKKVVRIQINIVSELGIQMNNI